MKVKVHSCITQSTLRFSRLNYFEILDPHSIPSQLQMLPDKPCHQGRTMQEL